MHRSMYASKEPSMSLVMWRALRKSVGSRDSRTRRATFSLTNREQWVIEELTIPYLRRGSPETELVLILLDNEEASQATPSREPGLRQSGRAGDVFRLF